MAGPQFRKIVEVEQLTDNEVVAETQEVDTSDLRSETLSFTSSKNDEYSTTSEFDSVSGTEWDADTSNDTITLLEDTDTSTSKYETTSAFSASSVTFDVESVTGDVQIWLHNDDSNSDIGSMLIEGAGTYTIEPDDQDYDTINSISFQTNSMSGGNKATINSFTMNQPPTSESLNINVPYGEKWKIKRVDIEIEGVQEGGNPDDGVFTIQHGIDDSETGDTMGYSFAEFNTQDAVDGLFAQCGTEWLQSNGNVVPDINNPDKFGQALSDIVLTEYDTLTINVFESYNEAYTYTITVHVRYSKLK